MTSSHCCDCADCRDTDRRLAAAAEMAEASAVLAALDDEAET